MGSPYTTQTISDYNTSPPADDASAVASNQVFWSKHKDKLADPIKTLAEAINTELVAAFAKLDLNQSRAISANDTQVAADERKLISATNTITYTLLPAATAGNGFTVTVLNAGTGVITIEADGSELIDGELNTTLGSQYRSVKLRCDGTGWNKVSNTGTWELIGTASASSDATVTFTWAGSAYTKVVFVLSNVAPATDDVALYLRTSTDGGSTYDSGTSDYGWVLRNVNFSAGTAASVNDNSDGQIALSRIAATDALGNAANEDYSGVVEVLGPTNSAYTKVLYRSSYEDAGGLEQFVRGTGTRRSSADVDGVQFRMSSGNIASGEFAAYGVV